jgi:hypothetical protein
VTDRERVVFQMSDGARRHGAGLAEIASYMAPVSVGFAGVTSWNVLANGNGVAMELDELRADCRPSFPWKDFVLRCAKMLAAIREEELPLGLRDEIARWALSAAGRCPRVSLATLGSHARTFEKNKSNLRLVDGEELVEHTHSRYEQFDANKGLVPLRRVYIPEVAGSNEE